MNRAGAREWLGLSVLLLPTVLLFLAMTVLFLATPQIAADLRPSGAQLLWINDIYGFMMAGLLVAMGTVGDRIGRRKVLLFGAAAFGVASAVAAFAPTAELLVAARAVMGVGAAAVMPSTLSLISNMFHDARQRATAIGLWAASISAGVALGPLVGGVLLESFWWGAALLAGVPVMALVLVGAPLLVPEYKAPGGTGRLDALSVVLSMATLLPLVYGIKELAKAGPTAAALLTIAAGLVLGTAFVRRQLRLETPLLDVRLFTNRLFSGALAVFMLAAVALGGVYLLFTQYLQLVAELSPLESGLWILPAALALVAVSTYTPAIARRIRPAYVIAAGLLVEAVGYIMLTQVGVDGLPLLVAGFFVLYPGIAPTMALTPGLVIGAAPPEKAGAASAVTTTASDLGTSLGVALLGSVGTAVYAALLPAGVPAQAAENLTTALSLGGADLAAQARDAFTGGLNVAAGVAAGLVIIGALLSIGLLRRVPPTEAAPAAAEDKELVSH
ncbi:MFS transporter [Nonomuraea sp. NPDC050328]|uniref:MFS transporter n=1 Tax=Nonomuraea sp. NPDC050328 TaxID=3364361 RepID=UPI0037893D33